jgi:hypothetical protein
VTGQHHLIVSDDPGKSMEIDHPAGCPQHGRLELVREEDGTVTCPFEELARREEGPERFFRRPDEQVPLFNRAASPVTAGRWPVWCWSDGQLRLVPPMQTNGGDAA